MVKKIGISLTIIVVIIGLFFFITKGTRSDENQMVNCSASTDNYNLCKERAINAIRNEAYALYYRGKAFQYDNTMVTFQPASGSIYGSNKRRSKIGYAPEEATIQDTKYLECDVFVNTVYSNTFLNKSDNSAYKINGDSWWVTALVNKACNNGDIKDSSNLGVYCINHTDGRWYAGDRDHAKSEKSINEMISELRDLLQPGDIIAYTYTDGDHVLLYLGDGEVIQATSVTDVTGGIYRYLTKRDGLDPYGTINIIDLDESVLISEARENVKRDKPIFKPETINIAILRPFNELLNDNYKISSKTLKRNAYPHLTSMKIASVNKYDSVNPGDEITYTIILENKSNKVYNNISVSDEIPNNTTYVSRSEGTLNGNKLSWVVSVPANSKKTIKYTVKVDGSLNTEIISDKTKVNDIELNTIKTTVKKTLTRYYQDKLIEKVATNSSLEYKDTGTFIQDIYISMFGSEKLGFNFADKTANDILEEYFDTSETIDVDNFYVNSNRSKATPIKANGDTGIKTIYELKSNVSNSFYVNGLFGGIYTKTIEETQSNPLPRDSREMAFYIDTFMVGDVLVVFDEDYDTDNEFVVGEKNMYLYLGSGRFATVDSNHNVVIIDNEQINSLSRLNYSKLIDSLIGQNAFITLRPSYLINDNFDDKLTVEVNSNAGTIKSANGWDIDEDLGTASQQFDYYDKYEALPTVTRDGYRFLGWKSGSLIKNSDFEQNAIWVETGAVASTSNIARYRLKDFVRVYPDTTYTINTNDSALTNQIVIYYIFFYDDNLNLIENLHVGSTNKTVTTPVNTAYMKMALSHKNTDTEITLEEFNNLDIRMNMVIDENTKAYLNETNEIYADWELIPEISVYNNGSETEYTISNSEKIISDIPANTTYEMFKTVVASNGEFVTDDDSAYVKTGDVITINLDGRVEYYALLVLGDVNSDGLSNIDDAKVLARYIIDKHSDLDEKYLLCGDINHDGRIRMNDIISIIKKK